MMSMRARVSGDPPAAEVLAHPAVDRNNADDDDDGRDGQRQQAQELDDLAHARDADDRPDHRRHEQQEHPEDGQTAISSEVTMPSTRFGSDRIAANESRLRLP